ncbi:MULTISPECIES: hypothetical protein [unclassified Mycobacterium]|uniref:hypothetical protein n=1 Tax=Mycobacterium sp. DL99 TaxID=2528957 RepID=UPI0010819FE8|nr:hypothetical protein [Mycobacterium sp. DL99]
MRYLAAALATMSVLAGCAVAGRPTAAPVDDEWRQAVMDAVAGLGTQLGPIGDAMTAPVTDYPALHRACTDMRAYVDSTQPKVLPGPDVLVNAALGDGFDGFRSMADQCVALTPANSATRLTKLGTTIDEAHLRMNEGLKLLGIEIPKR